MSDTRFKLGNPGGPGAPKKLKTQVKDRIKEHPYAVAALMQVLYDKGIDGDRECAMYVIDRIKGKPTSKIGLDEDTGKQVALAAYIELCKLQDKKQIGGYIDGEVIEGGAVEVTDAEDA